jgi:tyramine---L-glutamate ligase
MRILVHEWVTGGGLAGLPLPGSWASEGRAMRQAVVADLRTIEGIEPVVTLDPRFASDTGPWDSVVVVAGREDFTLSRLARQCDFTLLIAPETAGTLAMLTELVEEAGGRTLGSSPEAIALAADKHRLGAYLLKKGVPTLPVEWYDRSGATAPSFGYPAVVKPVDGAGSLDTFLLAGPDDHPQPTTWAGDLVIQPFCTGTAMSASYLVGSDEQARLLAVGWQHVEVREGRFVYLGGQLPGPTPLGLGAPLQAVQAVRGLRGFVGVDFLQRGDGQPVVIEINPRPTTSYIGLRRLYPPGALLEAWIDAVQDGTHARWPLPLDPPPPEGSLRFQADGTFEPDRGDHDGDHAD